MTRDGTGEELVKMSKLAELAGVPAPTIKHYMREGLLPEPARRTSRNMAYYDARLAARVKAIKELQQRHFLPLRLIGEVLEPPPSAAIRKDLAEETRSRLGSLAREIQAGHAAASVEQRTTPRKQEGLTREQVLDSLQITDADLALLTRLGVFREASGAGEQLFDGGGLDLLEVIDETRRLGLGEMFPMTILEPYVGAIRALVQVELNLFRQRVLESDLDAEVSVEQIATLAAGLGERLLLALRSQLLVAETAALAEPTPKKPSI